MQTQPQPPQLNIPLLRATIASIADENNPFDMMNWDCCIAGHIMKAAGVYEPLYHWHQVKELVGIPYLQAERLFSIFDSQESTDRTVAIHKLEWLIGLNGSEQCHCPLCSSALESRSRSTRAEAVEKQEEEESTLVGA